MELIKITDNSVFTSEELLQVVKLKNKICNKTLLQLQNEGIFVFPDLIKNSDDLSTNQFILQEINNKYITSNVMGFIGYKDEQLIINSRFASKDNDYFLWYMIEKVFDLPNIVDLKTGFNDENELINILVFLFPYYLKTALRKGVYKEYVRNNYNNSNIRGTIDISRHIKLNAAFIGNIAYNKREYSYDNYLLELIRHTIEFIKNKPYGKQILYKIKDEVRLITSLTNNYKINDKKKIIDKNKTQPIRHAYYKEYRTLQQLCLLILQQKKQQIGEPNNKVYGILFDGAWLWEEYINTLIRKDYYHPRNKIRTDGQKLFNNNIGLIFPDFIGKDKNNRIIADAKYKPINNIGGRDYLQLLAYMMRFDAKIGYYLYPENNSSDNVLELRLNKGTTYDNNVSPRNDIKIIKKGLKIPNNAQTYNEFKDLIKINENLFKI